MSPDQVVYVLTFASAVAMVLTRLRLSRSRVAGQHQVGMGTVNLHTGCGRLALACWVAFLVTGHDSSLLGIVALLCYWLTAIAGIMLLMRWLPSRGKHASEGKSDTWSEGPGLSILAHVGMLVGVCVFTFAYMIEAV